MILTNAAAKRDFFMWHFGVKISPVPRHTQCQDGLSIKLVTSSCPASEHRVVKRLN